MKIIGISSDGDPRLLSAMKNNVNLSFNASNEEEYSSIQSNSIIHIQDPTHVGTKLRNLLLKTSVFLPFGDKVISLTHLKLLISKVPKDIHGLTQSDISPDDRQNYKSLEKVMQLRVIDALKKYVTGSEATVVFITIYDNVTSSFLNIELTPIERVHRIWYAVFLIRIWRNFINSSDYYDLNHSS